MVYTSYYAKIKKIEGNNLYCSISNTVPPWIEDKVTKCLRQVYPKFSDVADFKHGVISWKEFENRYIEHVNMYVLYTLKETLLDYEKEYDNVFLLCYERPTDFCHRHILRRMLNNIGMEIREYDEKDLHS